MQCPVTFDSANRRKDKSVRLSFSSTFEVSPEDFMEMDKLTGNTGWCLFKENESFHEADLPKEDAPDESKTPSQRLRAAYYVFHQQAGKDKKDFNRDYAAYIETIIDRIKEKLE